MSFVIYLMPLRDVCMTLEDPKGHKHGEIDGALDKATNDTKMIWLDYLARRLDQRNQPM